MLLGCCRVTFKGREYFLAFVEKTARSTASQFCQSQQGGPYTASGALRWHILPPRFSAQALQWRTFDPDAGELCTGEGCPAFAVVECVKEGAEPLVKDEEGNIGCGNTGSNNVGSWNSGTGNWGGCNSGEHAAQQWCEPSATHLLLLPSVCDHHLQASLPFKSDCWQLHSC